MIWLKLIPLILLNLLHLKIDKKIWGFFVTPGVLIFSGYVFVIFSYSIASIFFDVKEVSLKLYLIMFLWGSFSICMSMLVHSMISWKKEYLIGRNTETFKFLRYFILCLSFFYLYKVYATLGGFDILWSSESVEYLSSGLVGHLHVFLGFLLVYYAMTTTDKGVIRWGVVLSVLLILSTYPVKGWVLIPGLAVFISSIFRENNFEIGVKGGNIKYFFIVIIMGFLIFFGIYYARSSGEVDANILFEEIFLHFLFYLTSGVSGFDAVLNGVTLDGSGINLIAPIFNVFSLILGDNYINIISHIYVPSIIVGAGEGNVYSFIGSVIGYTNILFGFSLCILFLFSLYLLVGFSWGVNLIEFKVVSIYFLSIVSFSWFEYYFWHLQTYEIFFYAFVLFIFRKIKIGVN